MTTIILNKVSRLFGDTTAVDSVSLTIPSGQLFFLLGPSGCGKTTLLRLISGLDTPSSGEIWFDNREVSRVPVENRNVGIVFQQYALWPHMSVIENIRFGLVQRRMDKAAIRDRLEEVLTLTQLTPLAERLPSELSGGQQQRVALARALALKPAVLLFDEPLSNLDPHLRHDIREQLIELHHALPTTMIYITHDTEEALSMADEIAILNRGRVIQSGKPYSLYHHPHNEFVARFLGESTIIDGTITRTDRGLGCLIGSTHLMVPTELAGEGEKVRLVIRPSYLTIPAEGDYHISGTIEKMVFAGPVTRLSIRCSIGLVIAATVPSHRCGTFQVGGTIAIGYDPATIARIDT